MKQHLYIFGVPALIGGAASKVRHLIMLLKNHYKIIVCLKDEVVVNKEPYKDIVKFIHANNSNYIKWAEFPKYATNSIALIVCVTDIFSSGILIKIKDSGAKTIFSNDMMWLFPGEAEAFKSGLIDRVLYVSDFQKNEVSKYHYETDYVIVENFILSSEFQFNYRRSDSFAIGRLSRSDVVKYPVDFPVFYEELSLKNTKYRVMAWDSNLSKYFDWHKFGPEWDLLKSMQEYPNDFLQTIDLFVYPLGNNVKESWGRSTVEAMLTGAVPIVPEGHQFENFINTGVTGFICNEFESYKEAAQKLKLDSNYRRKMALESSLYARNVICNQDKHLKLWKEALE